MVLCAQALSNFENFPVFFQTGKTHCVEYSKVRKLMKESLYALIPLIALLITFYIDIIKVEY